MGVVDNMDLKKFVLGEEGREYMRYAFGESRTLGKCLIESKDLNNGTLCTYLPPYVPDDEVSQFQYSKIRIAPVTVRHYVQSDGQRMCMAIAGSTSCPTSVLLHDAMQSMPASIALFEDWITEPSSPWLEARGDYPLMICGQELYAFALGPDATAEEINDSIWTAQSGYPPLVGIISPLEPTERTSWEGGRVDKQPEDLKSLAERARVIVVGAYDGEAIFSGSRYSASLGQLGPPVSPIRVTIEGYGNPPVRRTRPSARQRRRRRLPAR
jgi:hypothetical protein